DGLPRVRRRLDLRGVGPGRRYDDHRLHRGVEDRLPRVRDGTRPETGAELPRGRRGVCDDHELDLGETPQRACMSRSETARSQKRDTKPTGGHQRTLPRADPGHTTSTRSPRTPTSSSIMLDTTQQWLGTTWTTSPTRGRSRHWERSTTPCSSESPVIAASG